MSTPVIFDGYAHTDSDDSGSDSELDFDNTVETEIDVLENIILDLYLNNVNELLLVLSVTRNYDKYFIDPDRKK